jgi:hypothetical protein
MTTVLIATHGGCRVFTPSGERETELVGRRVGALAAEPDGFCLAIVDERQIWRRTPGGIWSQAGQASIPLQSIVSLDGTIFAGGMDEAVLLRIPAGGNAERLRGFDHTAGREEWFAGGPPLGVRSLAATADSSAILAAVHVGGIPRSVDRGESWTPTISIMFDVHEVRAHASLPNFVAAAAAVGLCLSHDGGQSWNVLSKDLDDPHSYAVALVDDQVLFSVQDGPFAKRSQLWRWQIDSGDRLEQVRDGLPEWFDGRVDTDHIAAGGGRVAVVDAGGNLWLSKAKSTGWEHIHGGLPYVSGVAIV